MRAVGLALEAEPRGKLEGAWPAGSECLTNPLIRQAERRRLREVKAKVRHVAHVKDIEDFSDEAKINPFVERDRLLNANVLRGEDVSQLKVRGERNCREVGSRRCLRAGNAAVVPGHQIPQFAITQKCAVPAT